MALDKGSTKVSAIGAWGSRTPNQVRARDDLFKIGSNGGPATPKTSRCLEGHQRLLEVGDDIFFVLDADR